MPEFSDRKKYMGSVKAYSKMLDEDPAIDAFRKLGTAMVGDFTNKVGGLPTRNFSAGTIVGKDEGPLKLGGQYIREVTLERGGEPTHACMPGCMIKCSNIYVDEDGKDMVSPLEYETLGLVGSNCGLTDPDHVAFLNNIANDLGIDTIEIGATIGVLMEAGEGAFGDHDYMAGVMEDIRDGNDKGKLYAQGTTRVGEHFNVKRIPAIKKQGISAYDPREIEVTGISMMVTAQGADHTTGNIPTFQCKDKSTEELVAASLDIQEDCAAADSLGLCLFGRSVTNINQDFIADALNSAHGTDLTEGFMKELGRETLAMEWQFNKDAGFTEEDDELPQFFYDEILADKDVAARHHTTEVNAAFRALIEK